MRRIRIGFELHSLNNLIRRYFDFSSHKKEIETITGNNGWIISYLAENADRDIYQKDLESKFTITRSTASRVLRLMEQKKLIKRYSVAHDARLKKIVLTKKAQKIKGLMKKDVERMEKILINGLAKEEVDTLHSYIQKMKKNISGVMPAL